MTSGFLRNESILQMGRAVRGKGPRREFQDVQTVRGQRPISRGVQLPLYGDTIRRRHAIYRVGPILLQQRILRVDHRLRGLGSITSFTKGIIRNAVFRFFGSFTAGQRIIHRSAVEYRGDSIYGSGLANSRGVFAGRDFVSALTIGPRQRVRLGRFPIL